MFEKNNRCAICERKGVILTKHHLIPKTRQKNKKVKRLFSREHMLTRVIWVCRSCHNHIHKVLTEKELALEYHSKDKLLIHPEIKKFATWLKGKPPGFKPKSG